MDDKKEYCRNLYQEYKKLKEEHEDCCPPAENYHRGKIIVPFSPHDIVNFKRRTKEVTKELVADNCMQILGLGRSEWEDIEDDAKE